MSWDFYENISMVFKIITTMKIQCRFILLFVLMVCMLLPLVAYNSDGFGPEELAVTASATITSSDTTPQILWWKLNEGSGTSITGDSSSGGDDGPTDAAWVTGKSGSGGALDFIPANSDDALTSASITYGVNVITVMGWFYFDDNTGTKFLYESSADNDSTAHTFVLAFVGGNLVGQIHGTSPSSTYRKESITAPATGAWTHIAVVFDNSTVAGDVKIYVDGSNQSTTVNTDTKDAAANFSAQVLYVGSRAAGSLFYDGRLDDFRIYNSELNSTAINAAKDDPQ